MSSSNFVLQIAFHNHFVEKLKTVLRSEESHELQCFFPCTDVPVIHANEVFETTALVREVPWYVIVY